MSWPLIASGLVEAVFLKDAKKNLSISFSGFFYGALKIELSASWSPDTYTALKRPGVACIHISFPMALRVAGYEQGTQLTQKEAKKAAALVKRAFLGFGYHEIGHLKLTDMSGEAFKALSQKESAEVVSFAKQVSNILEDPTQEGMLGRLTYYSFTRKYFKWMVERLFVPQAAAYKDDGSLRSFLNYLLLFVRLGGKRIPNGNVWFDQLAQRGFVKRIRAASREPNGIKRCEMQIDIALWIVHELQLDNQQLSSVSNMTPERPVIILVDPTSKGKKTMKQQPMDGPLPPVSVVEVDPDGDGDGEGGQPMDADVIDMRKQKPENGENPESGADSGGSDSDGSNGQTGNGDEGETSDGTEDGTSPSGKESSNAGEGRGTAPLSSSKGEDAMSGYEDPLRTEPDDFNDSFEEYDPDLTAAEAMGDALPVYADDEVTVLNEDKIRAKLEDTLREYSSEVLDLSETLSDIKAASAPKVYHCLEDGDDIDIDSIIESKESPFPSMNIFQEEKAGRDITDLAVSMLVDCSGSMTGQSCECAYATAAMVVAACGDNQIPTEISAFSDCDVFYIKRFDEGEDVTDIRLGLLDNSQWPDYSVSSAVGLWGGTQLPDALKVVLGKLEAKSGNAFKVLFIITDGDTGDKDEVRRLVAHAQSSKIMVVAIGIGQSLASLQQCFGECASFDQKSLKALPTYVSGIIKEALADKDLWLND